MIYSLILWLKENQCISMSKSSHNHESIKFTLNYVVHLIWSLSKKKVFTQIAKGINPCQPTWTAQADTDPQLLQMHLALLILILYLHRRGLL